MYGYRTDYDTSMALLMCNQLGYQRKNMCNITMHGTFTATVIATLLHNVLILNVTKGSHASNINLLLYYYAQHLLLTCINIHIIVQVSPILMKVSSLQTEVSHWHMSIQTGMAATQDHRHQCWTVSSGQDTMDLNIWTGVPIKESFVAQMVSAYISDPF